MSAISSLSRPASRRTTSAVATAPILPFLYPVLYGSKTKRPCQPLQRLLHAEGLPPEPRPRAPRLHTLQQMENVFITALARASNCHDDRSDNFALRSRARFASTYHKPRRRPSPRRDAKADGGIEQRKSRRHGSAAAAVRRDVTQEELIEMVDLYPIHEYHNFDREPPALPPIDPPSDEPITVNVQSRRGNDDETHTVQYKDVSAAVAHLVSLLKDPKTDNDTIFEAYQGLPYPRVSFLGLTHRNYLLNRLAVLPDHNETTLLRYLSVMDDLKVANITPSRSAWTSAIHLAGRPFGRVTDAEAESALYVWKDMEQRQGVRGDVVTFSVLFNIATKAHKFALADMIIRELEARGLQKTRAFRLSVIFRAGQQRDGEAVRRAYREFVQAGEIVDTTVLNCVITALYSAGEFGAAEAIFERMRLRYGAEKDRDIPAEHWREWRTQQRELQKDAERLRNDPVARQAAQNRAPLRPDGDTYRIMVRHACKDGGGGGDIDRVDELLAQMRGAEPPLQPTAAVFAHVFYGFAKFGRRPYSSAWTPARLDAKWRDYLDELERDPVGFALTRKMAVLILEAYLACVGGERVEQVWQEVRARFRTDDRHKGTGRGLEDLAAVERWVWKHQSWR